MLVTNDKTVWIERCAAHFVKITKITPAKALDYAKTCYDMDDPADGLTPEQAAENEMECWG